MYKHNSWWNHATLTKGEKMIRQKLDAPETDIVTQIKKKTAELINLCEDIQAADSRLLALSETNYEQAAMWAVKAATDILPS